MIRIYWNWNILKKILLVSLFAFDIAFASDSKTEKFKVSGNCDMCKKTIEKAAKTKGVETAEWNVDTKEMLVTFNAEKTNLTTIQKKIAEAGYDNDGANGNDKAYEKLPHCCHYDRK